MVDSGLGQGKYKMGLEHLVAPNSKKVLKKWGHVRDTEARLNGLPLTKLRTIWEKRNKKW